jgi:hypothetical protein
MWQSLAELIKDKETRMALIALGIISGAFLMVKSYHEIKPTKLRIAELEDKKNHV